MKIHTSDGIDIHCLPEDAKCACSGKSPEYMDKCPIKSFDDFGLECVPNLCDYYAEGDTDGYV